MKTLASTLPLLVAIFASSVLAWGPPSCAWNDCMSSWNAGSCTSSTGWDCLCTNQTLLTQFNTCVSTSCTNTTDQEVIYAAVAQICANAGNPVTATQEASFSATSGGSAWPSGVTAAPGFGGWNGAAWSSWVSACSTAMPGAPSGWNGAGPWSSWGNWGGPNGGGPGGPWGASGGPWATKGSGINCDAWTTWTAGWGPYSSWTGTWSACSATTATPAAATVTTTETVNGATTVVTGTTFGIQAVATAAASGSSSSSSAGAAASPNARAVGISAVGVVALLGVVVAL